MDLIYNPEIHQEPVKTHDCNKCKWLNLTEDEQRVRPDKSLHFCEKYHKRLYHRTRSPEHNYFLWPCNDCVMDDYEHYIERSNYV